MKKTMIAIAMFSVVSVNAMAGTLVCKGNQHEVTIDSSANTIQVSPEMTSPVPAVIANGPEAGLFVALDQAQTFLIYLGSKNGKMLGNLQSKADSDLEEKMVCKGSL